MDRDSKKGLRCSIPIPQSKPREPVTSSTSPRPCTLPHSYLRRPFLLNESDKMRSHTLTTLRCLLLLALAVGSIPGCSSRSDIPALGEVTGTVTLDGAPLEGATVTFAPPKGRPSTGMTNQQGQFMLDYAAGYQGAMIGNHTVRISTERYTENPDGTTDFFKETVPATFNSRSTLTADVKPGENTFDFELSSTAGKRKNR